VGDEVTLTPVFVAKGQHDGETARLRAIVSGVDVLDFDGDRAPRAA
jgi:hypothetical protein